MCLFILCFHFASFLISVIFSSLQASLVVSFYFLTLILLWLAILFLSSYLIFSQSSNFSTISVSLLLYSPLIPSSLILFAFLFTFSFTPFFPLFSSCFHFPFHLSSFPPIYEISIPSSSLSSSYSFKLSPVFSPLFLFCLSIPSFVFSHLCNFHTSLFFILLSSLHSALVLSFLFSLFFFSGLPPFL